MVFSSLSFLYFFLPLVLVLYFFWKNRVYRNTVLLLASLLFYSWGEPKYTILLLLASLVAYVGGLLMDRAKQEGRRRLKKVVFLVTISLLVLNLLVFKYLNFFVDNVNLLLDQNLSVRKIALPIGISFYTFQILSYVIDLYRSQVAVQNNYFYLTLYVSFFPQLIAGPIVRYQTIEGEIRGRRESWDGAAAGTRRFILGLAKKVILANNAASICVTIYDGNPELYGTVMYWIAALAYALQIYFDFSGYSDMAIGLGQIFGFHFLENFNYPYTALSITDFWRRWHISLSTWFRDYIYIPLGGNRVRKGRWVLNILIVWALTGFWHGAQWNFILWGLYYGVLLLLEKQILSRFLDKLPRFFRWLYTMFFVVIGWVIFNLTDFSAMTAALRSMFVFRATDYLGVVSSDASILKGLVYLPLGILCAFPLGRHLKRLDSTAAVIGSNFIYLALLGVCIMYIISSSYNPFIYFRF